MNSVTSAGGVGALSQIADHPSGKTYLPGYDGNGNVASLINADTGDLAAAYDGARERGDGPTARLARRAQPRRHRPGGGRARQYSAFDEPLRAQCFDPTVADNPFRFSTKFTDSETGLVYYGHRYYDPRNGRFINRDPIEESGGLNLYGFVRNNPVNSWDYLGLRCSIPRPYFGGGDYEAWLEEEYADWQQECRQEERDLEREAETLMMAPFEVPGGSWTAEDEAEYQFNKEAFDQISGSDADSGEDFSDDYRGGGGMASRRDADAADAAASKSGEAAVNEPPPSATAPTSAESGTSAAATTPVAPPPSPTITGATTVAPNSGVLQQPVTNGGRTLSNTPTKSHHVETDGKDGLRVVIASGDVPFAYTNLVILNSIKIHEGTHLLDALNANNAIGNDKPAGLVLGADPLTHDLGEYYAIERQLDYMNRYLSNPSSLTAIQIQQIDYYKVHVENYRSTIAGAPTVPMPPMPPMGP